MLMRVRVDPRDTVSPGILDRYIEDLLKLVPLQVVPAPDPVPAIGSASYPDMCVICQDPVVGEGCRVNCPAGHIFHCECINEWRNTRHNECPLCRQLIYQMYYVDIPERITTEFGKRIKRRITKRSINSGISLKSINSLIKLVQKI
jgi:hypothetical protein